MAKRGKWLSKLRRFLVCAREDFGNESNRGGRRDKKKGHRKLKHGQKNSFISLFQEPSSIEKILEDADREKGLVYRPASPFEQPKIPSVVLPRSTTPKATSPRSISPQATSPRAASPRAVSVRDIIHRAASPRAVSPRAASPRAVSPRAASPKAASPRAASSGVRSPKELSPRIASFRAAPSRAASPKPKVESPTPSPPRPPSRANSSKAASFKVIRREESISRIEPILQHHHISATKIQAAYRGYASRQCSGSARGLVRLHSVLRGQSVRRQTTSAMKQMQLLVRVQTRLQSQRLQMLESYAFQHEEASKSDNQAESVTSDAANNKTWDVSVLTNEETEARNRRKEEAIRNRERAKAFLKSHQMSKFALESVRSALMDLRIDGLPWSWNWSERHLIKAIVPGDQTKKKTSLSSPKSSTPRSTRSLRGNQLATPPRDSRSLTPSRFSQIQTPDGTPRSQYSSRSLLTKYSKPTPRGSQSPFDVHFTDTDSLQSCPPFSVPRYMSPTASAKAKMRLSNNFKDRYGSSPTPSMDSKRRLSYPLTPRSGTSRGPLFPDSDASSQRTVGTHRSRSIDNLSVGTPRSLGGSNEDRKPFNRFV